MINGVNRSSILDESRYFHVVDSISPDIMHDLLEGVLQFSIMELLKELIVNKNYFHIKTLNNMALLIQEIDHLHLKKMALLLPVTLHKNKQVAMYIHEYLQNIYIYIYERCRKIF